MFTIEKNFEINAPAEVVWEVITDFSKYGEWNPFIREAKVDLRPGGTIDMQVKLMARPQAQREWVKEVVPGKRFAYSMKPVPGGTLSSFRSHDVEAAGLNKTRYRSYFHLQGWLHPVVVALLGSKLQAGFAGMSEGIRTRSEQLWAQRQGK
jgi:uncharacterized protein YndB with AHSA1/START domain